MRLTLVQPIRRRSREPRRYAEGILGPSTETRDDGGCSARHNQEHHRTLPRLRPWERLRPPADPRASEEVGVDMKKEVPQSRHTMDDEFITQLVKYAQTHILAGIKHDARIPTA